MKSAYELAMERLEKEKPTVTLTEEQKTEIAEIDSIAKARTAEKELLLDEQLAKAKATGNWGEAEAIEKQRVSELRRLREDAEDKKARVRNGR